MCRRQSPANAPSCVCGHQFRTTFMPAGVAPPPAMPPQADLAMPAISVACPVCGNHDIQKVTAIVGQGAWATASRGHSIGGGHVFGGPNFVMGSLNFSNSMTMTEIAQKLAPPMQPRQKSLDHAPGITFTILAAITAFILMMTIALKDFGGSMIALGVLIGFGALAWYFFAADKRTALENGRYHAMAMNRWNQAMFNWEAIYYCPKCDSVHHAISMRAAPSHAMDALL